MSASSAAEGEPRQPGGGAAVPRRPRQRQGSGAKHWCMTVNNYTEDDEQRLTDFFSGDQCQYGIMGKETGEAGTPHLQCFFSLKVRHNLTWLKNHVHATAHFEVARGTPQQASEYCKKEDDYEEFGELPSSATGTQKQFEDLVTWAKRQETCPTEKEVAESFPGLFGRYRSNVMDMVRMFAPQPNIQSGELRGWQIELKNTLDGEADDRTIFFCVDHEGGAGKSWFIRWMLSKYPDDVQVMGPAKRDDLAHMVRVTTRIFLFNVPRGNMEYLNYGFLESLKDRVIVSPKYESMTKILTHVPHVVVFTNEDVKEGKLTYDRIKYVNCD